MRSWQKAFLLGVVLLAARSGTAVVAEEGECTNPDEAACAASAAAAAVVEDPETASPAADEEAAAAAPPAAEETTTESSPPPEDPNCPSRPHVVSCAGKYLDTNQNGQLEKEELETAINALPWFKRGILKIIGSVSKIMQKCDHDKDGSISVDADMEATKDTCLATCFKRKAFKNAFFPECEIA